MSHERAIAFIPVGASSAAGDVSPHKELEARASHALHKIATDIQYDHLDGFWMLGKQKKRDAFYWIKAWWAADTEPVFAGEAGWKQTQEADAKFLAVHVYGGISDQCHKMLAQFVEYVEHYGEDPAESVGLTSAGG